MINRVVAAVSKAVARVHSIIRAKAASLRDVHSPRRIPGRFARQLAWDVGFSDDLALSGHVATEDEWRRVAEIAMDVWATRGIQPSYRNIVRAMTGARIWIGDWFGLRTLAGLSGFPWYGTAVNGEYITHIHVEDVDGNLDRDKALESLNTVRPFGEGVVCTFVHFVESWDNLFRWTDSGPATVANNRLSLQGVASATLDETLIDPTGWAKVAHVFIAHIGAGDTLRYTFQWDTAGPTYYYVDVVEGGAGSVSVWRFLGGAVMLGTAAVAVRGWPAYATGTITNVAGALLVDGETFTINDGVGTTTIFEFDDDGSVAAGNVAVAFTAADTADQVRNAIITAINRTPSLRVSAAIGGAALTDLTHDIRTAQGDQPITETVANAGFVVTGMAGGVDEWGARIDVQCFPAVGPSLDIKVLVDGVHALTVNDPAPIAQGRVAFSTPLGGAVDVLYHEVVPLTAHDIRTLPH